MDFPTTAQDYGAVLGFLAPIGGGQTDRDFQNQYRATAGAGGQCDRTAGGS